MREAPKEKDDAFKEGPPAKRSFKGCKALAPNVEANQTVGDIVTIGAQSAAVLRPIRMI